MLGSLAVPEQTRKDGLATETCQVQSVVKCLSCDWQDEWKHSNFVRKQDLARKEIRKNYSLCSGPGQWWKKLSKAGTNWAGSDCFGNCSESVNLFLMLAASFVRQGKKVCHSHPDEQLQYLTEVVR